MPYISTKALLLFFTISSITSNLVLTSTVVEDLNNLHPPPDFNSTISKNCISNPSLRYCNKTPFDLPEIFKSTIVASHLCNISNNTNCIETFPKIDLHNQPKSAPLYLSFNFFWKYCPLTILSINLSNNSLKGSFPIHIFQCSQIKSLDLSHNSFSGDVPIQNFSVLENLTFLNLSYNKFSESKISDSPFFKRLNYSCFIHSGIIPNHNDLRIKAFLLLFGFPVFVIFTVAFMGWVCFWRPDLLPRFLRRKYKFTHSILYAATDGFSKRNLVGKNAKVGIYKGYLRDETVVRIIVYVDNMSRENRRRFVEECKILVHIHHGNIVRVLGWCDSRRFRALVSEWKNGENAETWLGKSATLWSKRVKVILGVASGICYLHENWPEIGYDLKIRNLLICGNGEALITKFKLDNHQSNTKNSYKFGMFILEMVANRRPANEFENGEKGFIEWVKSNYPNNLENVIDKRMSKSEQIVHQATEVIRFGLELCIGSQQSWDKMFDAMSNIASMAESISPEGQHRRSCLGHKHAHHNRQI